MYIGEDEDFTDVLKVTCFTTHCTEKTGIHQLSEVKKASHFLKPFAHHIANLLLVVFLYQE